MNRLSVGLSLMLSLLFFSSEVLPAVEAWVPAAVTVTVLGRDGKPLLNAKVALVLKSGAYQSADLKDGVYISLPTQQPAKVFAACEGYEAYAGNCNGQAPLTITLAASAQKNSTVIHRRGPLPGIEGDINPILDSSKRTYVYATKIGLMSSGRPALQPLYFKLKQPIEAVSSTGSKFRIWVKEITPEVSLVEYTKPAS